MLFRVKEVQVNVNLIDLEDRICSTVRYLGRGLNKLDR